MSTAVYTGSTTRSGSARGVGYTAPLSHLLGSLVVGGMSVSVNKYNQADEKSQARPEAIRGEPKIGVAALIPLAPVVLSVEASEFFRAEMEKPSQGNSRLEEMVRRARAARG